MFVPFCHYSGIIWNSFMPVTIIQAMQGTGRFWSKKKFWRLSIMDDYILCLRGGVITKLYQQIVWLVDYNNGTTIEYIFCRTSQKHRSLFTKANHKTSSYWLRVYWSINESFSRYIILFAHAGFTLTVIHHWKISWRQLNSLVCHVLINYKLIRIFHENLTGKIR